MVKTRPMKGTIRRGRWLAEDEALARTLATSRKAQAENVMIVDLLRNDIGRVSDTGTVRVSSLFELEKYPTLWQMTSTIEGRLRPEATLVDVFDALFPCGSVTGAPKIRTMEVIAALEGRPRGVYTGAIGLLRPDGTAVFNVAIRTIVVDHETAVATLAVGAGITADSIAEDEYEECLLKGQFASAIPSTRPGSFQLLETMRLQQGSVLRLDRHLARMRNSARYFDYSWDEARVRDTVARTAAAHPDGVWRLRVTCTAEGEPLVTCTAHDAGRPDPWRVAFANAPIDDADPFLFNKTTCRTAYETARRGRPDVDDVLLWNGRREVTESTIANLVVEIDGQRYTPPVDSGLLAGTLREELIESGRIRERVITRGEVVRAERIWLVNSLRGWIDAVLVR
jgi:para-aminobenzoate synthetase/4-amino-4-deoxychorismate lyase